MKYITEISLIVLLAFSISHAQNPIGVNVMYRSNGVVNAAPSTNNPTLASVNLSTQNMFRAFINIQNTNTVSINIYSDSLGSNLIHTVIPNETYTEKWPVTDNTQFYIRSIDVNSIPASVSEAWGR